METERQSRAEIEDGRQGEHEREREDVNEQGNRDRRGPEPRDAKDDVADDNDEGGENQRRRPENRAVTIHHL